MKTLRQITAAIGLGVLSSLYSTGAAFADRLVVVELFTSQGCSSCPPADALLGKLAERRDVLPLALHVDYWDYIGWKDTFADPENTARQKSYARRAGKRSVFTPQMVVDGQDHIIGADPMKLAMLVRDRMELADAAEVTATRRGGKIDISINDAAPGGGICDVILVRYEPKSRVKIARGENRGRTITYHNIVTDMTVVGRWNGNGSFTRSVTAPADGHYAVIVQHRDEGPILAAARVD